jgi:hypothetical protein
MQEFYINKDSNLPSLRMELILDGRHNFRKFYEAIQNASITFSMTNLETGIDKIVNAPCSIMEMEEAGCSDAYLIVHKWKKRETNERGVFKGAFTIVFGDDLTNQDGTTYDSGNLIMPIREELMITIR